MSALRHGEDGWELVDACRYRDPGHRGEALDVTALEYERFTLAGDIERATRVRVNGEAPADSQLPWGPW